MMIGKILVVVGLAAVLAVLFFGIATMLRGGEFNRKYGNKLMQLRVAVQFAVILLLGILLWMSQK
jgi:hypothetical protein